MNTNSLLDPTNDHRTLNQNISQRDRSQENLMKLIGGDYGNFDKNKDLDQINDILMGNFMLTGGNGQYPLGQGADRSGLGQNTDILLNGGGNIGMPLDYNLFNNINGVSLGASSNNELFGPANMIMNNNLLLPNSTFPGINGLNQQNLFGGLFTSGGNDYNMGNKNLINGAHLMFPGSDFSGQNILDTQLFFSQNDDKLDYNQNSKQKLTSGYLQGQGAGMGGGITAGQDFGNYLSTISPDDFQMFQLNNYQNPSNSTFLEQIMKDQFLNSNSFVGNNNPNSSFASGKLNIGNMSGLSAEDALKSALPTHFMSQNQINGSSPLTSSNTNLNQTGTSNQGSATGSTIQNGTSNQSQIQPQSQQTTKSQNDKNNEKQIYNHLLGTQGNVSNMFNPFINNINNPLLIYQDFNNSGLLQSNSDPNINNLLKMFINPTSSQNTKTGSASTANVNGVGPSNSSSANNNKSLMINPLSSFGTNNTGNASSVGSTNQIGAGGLNNGQNSSMANQLNAGSGGISNSNIFNLNLAPSMYNSYFNPKGYGPDSNDIYYLKNNGANVNDSRAPIGSASQLNSHLLGTLNTLNTSGMINGSSNQNILGSGAGNNGNGALSSSSANLTNLGNNSLQQKNNSTINGTSVNGNNSQNTLLPQFKFPNFLDGLNTGFLLDEASIQNADEIMKKKEKQRLERSQKIEKYKNKKRNWVKKISYDCRKKVADARLRIKGRFISKKDSEKIHKLVDGKRDEAFNNKNNLKEEFLSNRITMPKKEESQRGCVSRVNLSKKEILSKIDGLLNSQNNIIYTERFETKVKDRIRSGAPVFKIIQGNTNNEEKVNQLRRIKEDILNNRKEVFKYEIGENENVEYLKEEVETHYEKKFGLLDDEEEEEDEIPYDLQDQMVDRSDEGNEEDSETQENQMSDDRIRIRDEQISGQNPEKKIKKNSNDTKLEYIEYTNKVSVQQQSENLAQSQIQTINKDESSNKLLPNSNKGKGFDEDVNEENAEVNIEGESYEGDRLREQQDEQLLKGEDSRFLYGERQYGEKDEYMGNVGWNDEMNVKNEKTGT